MGSYLAHGPKIYPKAHENLRAFSCISNPIFLESSIQCPWGVGLHHPYSGSVTYLKVDFLMISLTESHFVFIHHRICSFINTPCIKSVSVILCCTILTSCTNTGRKGVLSFPSHQSLMDNIDVRQRYVDHVHNLFP